MKSSNLPQVPNDKLGLVNIGSDSPWCELFTEGVSLGVEWTSDSINLCPSIIIAGKNSDTVAFQLDDVQGIDDLINELNKYKDILQKVKLSKLKKKMDA